MDDLSVTEENCKTAEELFDLLSPVSIHSKAMNGKQFVFRGQSCCQQLLVPTSYRARDRLASTEAQSEFERKVLCELYEASNKSGLAIPNYDTVLPFLGRISGAWPPVELHRMIAFAQHHGVPTRFLDWTYMPYVAIYFAASGVISTITDSLSRLEDGVTRETVLSCLKNKKLAIWQLELSNCLEHSSLKRHSEVVVVRTHAASSVNLAPQGGVFTLTPTYSVESEKGRPDFLHALSDMGQLSCVTKYTVPYTQALALVQMCGAVGINEATLFPGVDGVVRKTMQQLDISKVEAFFQYAKD